MAGEMRKPDGVGHRAWEAAARLYEKSQALDDEEMQVGQTTQDPEEAKFAWMVMAAGLVEPEPYRGCTTCLGTMECPECEGTGREKSALRPPCWYCNETGRCPDCKPFPKMSEMCPKCQGSGSLEVLGARVATSRRCEDCGGSGRKPTN